LKAQHLTRLLVSVIKELRLVFTDGETKRQRGFAKKKDNEAAKRKSLDTRTRKCTHAGRGPHHLMDVHKTCKGRTNGCVYTHAGRHECVTQRKADGSETRRRRRRMQTQQQQQHVQVLRPALAAGNKSCCSTSTSCSTTNATKGVATVLLLLSFTSFRSSIHLLALHACLLCFSSSKLDRILEMF